MKRRSIAIASALLFFSTAAMAQNADLLRLIDRLADEMNTEIIYDQRLSGVSAATTSATDAGYESLQAMLRTAGFFTVETADQILILPDETARSAPSRILQEDDRQVSDHEIVTRVIAVDGIPPAQLVPILRPMMPQYAQLGAVQGTNKLIVVDRYDNIRRMTRVVEELLEGIVVDDGSDD